MYVHITNRSTSGCCLSEVYQSFQWLIKITVAASVGIVGVLWLLLRGGVSVGGRCSLRTIRSRCGGFIVGADCHRADVFAPLR